MIADIMLEVVLPVFLPDRRRVLDAKGVQAGLVHPRQNQFLLYYPRSRLYEHVPLGYVGRTAWDRDTLLRDICIDSLYCRFCICALASDE